MKASVFEEGYAREEEGAGKEFGESDGEAAGVGNGRGCWIEREGRESLVVKEQLVSELLLVGSYWYLPQNLEGYRMRFLDRIPRVSTALLRHISLTPKPYNCVSPKSQNSRVAISECVRELDVVVSQKVRG